MAQIKSSMGAANKPVKIMDLVKKYFWVQKEQTPKQKLKVAKRIVAGSKKPKP
jgi:hypothetical protein